MKKIFTIISIIIMSAMLLSACATPTAAPTEAPTVAPTEVPAVATKAPAVATVAPTAAPTEVPLGPVLKIGQITSASGVMMLYSQQQVRGFEIGLEYASAGKKMQMAITSLLIARSKSS